MVTTSPRSAFSPLQSDTWEAVCRGRGKSTFSGVGTGWHALAILEHRRFGRYLYLPYGPVAQDAEALEQALRWARGVAHNQRAMFLRVEPPTAGPWYRSTLKVEVSRQAALLHHWGFVSAPADLQPRRTRCIDLRASDQEILGNMTGTNRTVYRSTAERGLEIRTSHDPKDMVHLTELIDRTAARQGFTPHAHTELAALAQATLPQGASTLFLAEHKNNVVSAVLAVDGGDMRIFAHGASDRDFSKLRAHQSLIVTAILDAKERGLLVADLYGIAPSDDPEHPWAGFSKFKASFGGYVVEHSGAWDFPVWPMAYHAMTGARRVIAAMRPSMR